MLKRIIVFICLFCLASISVFAETSQTEKPNITSAGYVLYNPDNDEVVDSINATERMYPASLTKMLTALVAVDLSSDIDNETATVSENAIKSLYGTSSSTSGLKIGETFTIRQLLYCLILPSGNDAANVLAEHFCGDNYSFVQLMNKKAQEIGMADSNFANPHGLHDENHYTTAKDLAVLADNFLDNKVLSKIAGCVEYSISATNKQGVRDIRTTNFMKIQNSGYYYQFATGLKTGNTEEAGRCLAASAEKDGIRYICILLNCPEKWQRWGYIRTEFLEAAEIFEYAFKTFETVKIASKGQFVAKYNVFETYNKQVDIVLSDDVFATLPKGTNLGGLSVSYKCDKLRSDGLLPNPINYGDNLGEVSLLLDNRVLGVSSVMANNTVNAHWWLAFWHKIDFYVYLTLIIIVSVILIFFLLIIRKKIILIRRKIQKQKRLEKRKKLQEEFESKEPLDYFNIKSGH